MRLIGRPGLILVYRLLYLHLHCSPRGLGSPEMPGGLINPGPRCAHRMSLRTQIQMGKKRHHSLHPKPVTPLPTFRGEHPRNTRKGHSKLPRAS